MLTQPHADRALPDEGKLPGEPGIWVLIGFELSMFVAAFGSYLWSRGGQPDLYARSQDELTLAYAVTNTVLLLTSSWLVAVGVTRARQHAPRAARRVLGFAMLCAVAFLGFKALEYSSLLRGSHGPSANMFFEWYFVLTGLHVSHLVVGLLVLGVLRRIVGRMDPGVQPPPRSLMHLEIGATYWHMVDVVWILMFAVLYLVR